MSENAKISLPASGRFMIALHPGEVLRELYLEPLSLSATDAAVALDMSRQHLTELLDGRRDVTPDIAGRLEAAFRASACSWLNMQANYDLEQERRHAEVSNGVSFNPELPDE